MYCDTAQNWSYLRLCGPGNHINHVLLRGRLSRKHALKPTGKQSLYHRSNMKQPGSYQYVLNPRSPPGLFPCHSCLFAVLLRWILVVNMVGSITQCLSRRRFLLPDTDWHCPAYPLHAATSDNVLIRTVVRRERRRVRAEDRLSLQPKRKAEKIRAADIAQGRQRRMTMANWKASDSFSGVSCVHRKNKRTNVVRAF